MSQWTDFRCHVACFQMGSIPVTRIRAHDAKIYGIDWSRSNGLELVTCSLGASAGSSMGVIWITADGFFCLV